MLPSALRHNALSLGLLREVPAAHPDHAEHITVEFLTVVLDLIAIESSDPLDEATSGLSVCVCVSFAPDNCLALLPFKAMTPSLCVWQMRVCCWCWLSIKASPHMIRATARRRTTPSCRPWRHVPPACTRTAT